MFDVTQRKQINNFVQRGFSLEEIQQKLKCSRNELDAYLISNKLKNTQIGNYASINKIKKYLSEHREATVGEIAYALKLNLKYVADKLKLISNTPKIEKEIKVKQDSYTKEEEQYIIESKRKGLSNKSIGTKLKRSGSAISFKYNQLLKKIPLSEQPLSLNKSGKPVNSLRNKKIQEGINKLKEVKSSKVFTLDEQLQIGRSWKGGWSKKRIADYLNVTIEELEMQWDNIAGLGRASDEFKDKVIVRYLQGFNSDQISRMIEADYDRVNTIVKDEIKFSTPTVISDIKKEKLSKEKVKARKFVKRYDWTEERDKKLIDLRNQGKTYQEVSDIIGGTKHSIYLRCSFLGCNNKDIKVAQANKKECTVQPIEYKICESEDLWTVGPITYPESGKEKITEGEVKKIVEEVFGKPCESAKETEEKINEVFNSPLVNELVGKEKPVDLTGIKDDIILKMFKKALKSNKRVVFII